MEYLCFECIIETRKCRLHRYRFILWCRFIKELIPTTCEDISTSACPDSAKFRRLKWVSSENTSKASHPQRLIQRLVAASTSHHYSLKSSSHTYLIQTFAALADLPQICFRLERPGSSPYSAFACQNQNAEATLEAVGAKRRKTV